ncbi:hypothetical protein HYS54_03990 [Candidatus Micrarchaeota archaeon]|nr:hypothetical protein [Candidatus Micrarchaeota archaeon]
MAEKAIERRVGSLAFILGVIVAIIAGATSVFLGTEVLPPDVVAALLVLFGAVVGFLNVGEKDTSQFLLAAVALMAGAGGGLALGRNIGTIPGVGVFIYTVLSNIAVFVAPAAIIVALKAVWNLSSKL